MTASLQSILEAARARVGELRGRGAEIKEAARRAPPPPAWSGAFVGSGVGEGEVAVIAEIKRRSPSTGVIAPGLDPASHARAYVAGGARAVSVLTEGPHFGGSLGDLAAVRGAVAVPVLRKDFVVDALQLYESRAVGASAVLLIVRVLDPGLLRELSALARDMGLARLVEVHAPDEVDRALALAPDAVGVNCRDLETFAMRPDAAAPLLAAIPHGVVAVAESGIATRADVERVAAWGADAILVGTALAGAPHPAEAVARLVGVRRAGTMRRGGGLAQ